MSNELKIYRIYHSVIAFLLKIFYRIKPKGLENVPSGPAIICANHSHWIDPVFIAVSYGRSEFIHMMAKAELFKSPISAFFMKKLGAFSVNRGKSDVSAIKNALKFLKGGEKIGIFPEGTRVSEDNAVAAKRGAIRLAEMTGAPIVPVYIPRRKRLFDKIHIVFGTPYNVEKKVNSTPQDYENACQELMGKIYQLNPGE